MVEEQLEFVRLASFARSTEAGLVLELLRNNCVRAVLEGVNFGALEPLLVPGGFSEIQLLVAKPDLERGRALYEAFFVRHQPLEADQEVEDPS